MELRHLRYFVAVAEERSFLRAAERLHISQPPLSTQVKDLEEELGVQLLQRSSKGIQLTQAGEVFYGEARAVLARVEHARVAARRAARGEEGRLSIGFISVVDYSFLPAALKAFRDRYPGVDVQLHELTTDAQMQELVSERLDVGIGIAPVEHELLTFQRVVSEHLVLAAPSALLPQAVTRVSLKTFASQPFVMIPRAMAPGYYDAFAALCRGCGFQPNIAQRAKQMQTVISLVSNGFGVALVPQSLMNLQRTGVVYAPIRERSPPIVIGLLYRRKDVNPAIQLFADTVKETIARGDDAKAVVQERPPEHGNGAGKRRRVSNKARAK